MEQQYTHTVDGQAFDEPELNLVSQEAALADDRLLAELLRCRPYKGGGSPVLEKLILPYRIEGTWGDGVNTSAMIRPNGATGQVMVYSFRAIIGTRNTTIPGAWYEIRTGRYEGSGNSPIYSSAVQLAATVANNRWDLIYARVAVEIPSASENRVVRTIGGVATQSLPLYTNTLVSLGVVAGSEATAPTLPALPTDGTPSAYYYYIPLAYVLLEHPFTLGSVVETANIREIAPVAHLSQSTGAATMGPVSFANSDASTLWGQRAWSPAVGRPQEFLPSIMSGSIMRFIALDMSDATKSIADDATVIIDNSLDWSNRVIWFLVYATRGGFDFAWMTGGREPQGTYDVAPAEINQTALFVGNTFDVTLPALALNANWPWWGVAETSSIEIGVDASGYLTATYDFDTTDIDMRLMILAIASAQYRNAK